nr:MAG TPA: hypothetical protein [Caudoviricetes sp.]
MVGYQLRVLRVRISNPTLPNSRRSFSWRWINF